MQAPRPHRQVASRVESDDSVPRLLTGDLGCRCRGPFLLNRQQLEDLHRATANPENPSGVNVSQPSDALVAQADAKSTLNGLFRGLGAVALLVGAVGVANIMIISVLERRSEIGLRRALGATRGHIRTQFLSEAVLLGLLGGVVGVAAGAAATFVYAHTKH